PVGERGEDGLQVFPGRLGRAGEIHDERPLPDARRGPGQHGPVRHLHGGVAHGLRNAGGQPVTHGEGGLRRHIPGGEAGASGGDDEIHRLPVAPLPQGSLDPALLVRDNGGLRHRVPGVFQNFHN
ncbi:50S ribosomal protein L7/L12, partial [Dysosmobacter welbionis]